MEMSSPGSSSGTGLTLTPEMRTKARNRLTESENLADSFDMSTIDTLENITLIRAERRKLNEERMKIEDQLDNIRATVVLPHPNCHYLSFHLTLS